MSSQLEHEHQDEWMELLSTTQNRKITQRGRYLEVTGFLKFIHKYIDSTFI